MKMSPYFLWICLLVFWSQASTSLADWTKTIYQKFQQEPEYSSFSNLVRRNRIVSFNLHYEPLTVFVPENKALDSYNGDTYPDLAFYHMSFEVKTLQQLQTTNVMSSVNLDNPPLWITKVDGEIYVNNAKILKQKSNYVSQSRSGDMGHQQVLHVVDAVLDPMVRSPKFSPNAYDLISSTSTFDLPASKTITLFYQKAREYKLLESFKTREFGTFFIPIDAGIDPNKYRKINRKVIQRHLVPNYVLFTRPSEKNIVTLTNDETTYSIFIERRDEKLFVKFMSRDSSELEFEELSSEILVSDIPLRNGVAHLISQPLGNFKESLKPFPYLPIAEKLSNDPELDIFYKWGTVTKFNENFERTNVSFTYFVPKDSAWIITCKSGLEPVEDRGIILARHLVVSQSPYSMEQLASLTRINNYTDIQLDTVGGPLMLSVLKIDRNYFIKWNNRYIEVVRPDFECTNGLVHILNGPMAVFKKTEAKVKSDDAVSVGDSLTNYWDYLKNNIF